MYKPDNKWFCCVSKSNNYSARLIVFPHAGGDAMYYLPMEKYSNDIYKLMCVNLPGRDVRSDTPMYSNLRKLARDFVEENESCLNNKEPYIIMGHSMGAIIAYEATSYIEEKGYNKPQRLIVSGAVPPREADESFKDVSDKRWDVEKYLLELGGVSEELLENEEFREYYMPIIIRDFRACNKYFYEERPKLSVPINVFYGFEDHSNDSHLYSKWEDYTTNSCTETGFAGGHFFVRQSIAEVCENIALLAKKG